MNKQTDLIVLQRNRRYAALGSCGYRFSTKKSPLRGS
jgi:hypothetical protein